MTSKGLLLLSLSIILSFRVVGQATDVLQLCSQKDRYKERNIFLTKPNFEVVQIVFYNGRAIDNEYELQLLLRVLKRDSLIENKVFNVEKDTGLIKCSFDLQSVWNWEPEKTNIAETVAVIKRRGNKMTLRFNLTITELRRNRIYLYISQRTFLKSGYIEAWILEFLLKLQHLVLPRGRL